jgi:hypothetical protein
MTLYVGIDPGTTGGAWAALNERGELKWMDDLFSKKGDETYPWERIDLIGRILGTELRYGPVWIAIEQPTLHSPSKSIGVLFEQVGAIKQTLDIFKLMFETVSPKTWQADLGLSSKKDRKLHADDRKAFSCWLASGRWPESEFYTKRGAKLDGRADAALIAEWLRRRYEI